MRLKFRKTIKTLRLSQNYVVLIKKVYLLLTAQKMSVFGVILVRIFPHFYCDHKQDALDEFTKASSLGFSMKIFKTFFCTFQFFSGIVETMIIFY